MTKLRKVVHLKVFDFEKSSSAYAVSSNKNKFGYMFQNEYYCGNRKVYESPLYDNVSDNAFYWLAFRINRSQLATLKKRVNKLIGRSCQCDDTLLSKVIVSFTNGSDICYEGEHKEEFKEKVLGLKS